MARSDYTPEQRKAWSQERYAQEIASGRVRAHDAGVKNLHGGKDLLNRLSGQASKEIEREALRHKAMAAGKGATIHANQPSDCFVSLSWKDGVAHAVFVKRDPGDGYDYDGMTKEQFLDWALSDSLGEYFNANIR